MRLVRCDSCKKEEAFTKAGVPPDGWKQGAEGKDFCKGCLEAFKKGKVPLTEEEKLVTRLTEFTSGLNDWEMNFVNDIAKQVLERKRPLSVDQLRIARKIDDRLN